MLTVFAVTLSLLIALQSPTPPQEPYTLGADSQVQAGVPKGRIEGPFLYRSKVFAGTIRHYWVYVPAQYDAASPACGDGVPGRPQVRGPERPSTASPSCSTT